MARNLLLICELTLREAARRRLVLSAIVATAALVALIALGFHHLATFHQGPHAIDPHDLLVAASGIEIALAFMFSFVLALAAAFLGALSLGNEVENGALLAILPRPIRRFEVVLGKWLGNAILLAAYAGLSAALAFIAVDLVTGYAPPEPMVTIAFLAAQSVVLLTLALALSIRLSPVAAGFVTVVLYGIGWIGGIAGSMASAFHNSVIRDWATLVSLVIPSDGLWRAASYSMEPVALRVTAMAPNTVNPLVPSAPPPTAFMIWSLAWCAIVFIAGARAFQARDM